MPVLVFCLFVGIYQAFLLLESSISTISINIIRLISSAAVSVK